jgi:hypothetical protein
MMRRSIVKSIQRGTITVNGVTDPSATATIAAVNPLNTLLFRGGQTWTLSGGRIGNRGEGLQAMLVLTNPTTVTATCMTTTIDDGVTAVPVVVAYSVVEYWPGVIRGIQSGIISLVGAALTNTATLSPAVNISKTFVYDVGVYGCWDQSAMPRVELTNATTITATRTASFFSLTTKIGWTMVEFY